MHNHEALLLENAIIYSFGDPPGQAESLAIQDGHIFALGDREELRQTIPSTFARIDLGGRIIIPGLTDAHIHFENCLLYTSPSPRDRTRSRMPSSA